jgi:hypothetical protein
MAPQAVTKLSRKIGKAARALSKASCRISFFMSALLSVIFRSGATGAAGTVGDATEEVEEGDFRSSEDLSAATEASFLCYPLILQPLSLLGEEWRRGREVVRLGFGLGRAQEGAGEIDEKREKKGGVGKEEEREKGNDQSVG